MESSALPSPPPSRTSKSTQTAPPPSTAASSRPDPPADAVQSGSIGGVREASRPPPRIAPRPAALARTSRSTQTAPPPLAVGSSRLARVGVTGVVTGAYVLLPRIAPATPPSMRTSKSTQVAPPPSTAELTRPSPSVNPSAPARHAQQDMVVSSGQNADVERTAAKETTSNQDMDLATKAALCDEASIMVANFALKMIEDIDSHMGCALASRSQIDTTTVGNRLKSVEKENQRMVDSSTMHDQSQLGGEEVDDDQTVHVGVEKEKASRSHCRLKSAPEKVVKGKKSSPKASKAKKPRNTLLVGEQTSVMAPPVGIESSAQLQPQVTIPSSSVSWPYIANYPIF
ncbi:hypothetical protein Taro_000232 [Colocasia esculenta]|uniref:Uncharacterized protein n=1 Tax=Colocasia esculenta TaxID=4460 RepID=A0A843TCF3_COLES|nr:hypothetical protein [Colocasia esculenta]